MSTADKSSTNDTTVERETENNKNESNEIESKTDTIDNDNNNNVTDDTLTISSIQSITDADFENVDLALHRAVLTFNELLNDEDTSQWYFLEKVHENYFPTKDKWSEYLKKISPNKPIDLHDIRKQIINGYYNKNDEKKLLNDIGSVFTNAMIRYNDENEDEEDDDDDNDELYDESQRLLTKFQTLCSEMEKEKEAMIEAETKQIIDSIECEDDNDSKDDEDEEEEDGDIIIPSTDDVFEIEDYYCASPWERLISEIEKQLQAWNLHQGNEECAIEYRQQMKNNSILSTVITINNSSYNYILEYHDYTEFIEPLKNVQNKNGSKLNNKYYTLSMNEMITRERDPTLMINNTHEICSWFGVSRFILLLPGNNNIDYIDESECMFMYSTLSIAVFNIQCPLAYFIPFGDQWDMSFRGGLKYNRYCINYISKSQRSIPPLCEYLDGIFKVFKRHLKLYYDESDPMLQMSTSINGNPLYRIYGLVSYKYIYDPSTNILALLNHNWRDFIADDKISYGCRWGPTYSPLKSLSLQTIWTYFPEGAFIDNIAHTDLDPYNAPKWIINAVWDELSTKDLQSQRNTPLTKSLYQLLIIARDLVEDCDIVWRDIISSNAIKQQDIKQVMIEKRQSSHDGSENIDSGKLMSPADSKHPLFEDFINQNVLKNDLYLDDDLDFKKMENEHEGKDDNNGNQDDVKNIEHEYFVKSKIYKSPSPPISQPKCVPFGSLMSIFVLRLFEIEDIDIGHIGDLWYKLTYEVSNRWTDCKLLPGIYGLPDFRTCLLHQKLQLLNECIRRKMQHRDFIKFKAEKLSKMSPIPPPPEAKDDTKPKRKESDNMLEIDEIAKAFALDEDENENDEQKDNDDNNDNSNEKQSESTSPVNERPDIPAQGVEKRHPYLFLLSDPNIPINIPITQDHPIFTADKLEAHYEELVSLGSSVDASKKRAELQSKQLKSDMMAFKAANPKCQLEDFIRWYSPNDWIVDDGPSNMADHHGDNLSNIMNQDLNNTTLHPNDEASEEIVYFDSDEDGSDDEDEGQSYSDDVPSTDSDGDNTIDFNKKKRKKSNTKKSKNKNKQKKSVSKSSVSKQNKNASSNDNDNLPSTKLKSGHLSSRMRAKDNIWRRIWDECSGLPAMEQELLFDYDIEGNEALKWIMNLQPTDTLLQICQIGIGNCISILKRTPGVDQKLTPLTDMIQSLIKSTKKIWKLNKQTNENYLDLELAIKGWSKELRLAEMGCACGAALTFKFNTKYCKNMIEKLMIQPFSSQIMSMREKESVLSIIGQRIYDDMDESEDDNSDNDNDEGKNFGFWNWGSPKDNKDRARFKYDNNHKDSIVIYDEDDGDLDEKKQSTQTESNNNNNNKRGRRYELPKPSSKQYNVLASAPRPHPDSQPTPNRMHVTIDQYGFKMALATSTIE